MPLAGPLPPPLPFCIRPHFCCVLYKYNLCVCSVGVLEFESITKEFVENSVVKSVTAHVRNFGRCISDLLTIVCSLCKEWVHIKVIIV